MYEDKPSPGSAFLAINIGIILLFLITWIGASYWYHFAMSEVILSFASVMLLSAYFIMLLMAGFNTSYTISPDSITIKYGIFKPIIIPRASITDVSKKLMILRPFGKNETSARYAVRISGVVLKTETLKYYISPQNSAKFLHILYPDKFEYSDPENEDLPQPETASQPDPHLAQLELEDDAQLEFLHAVDEEGDSGPLTQSSQAAAVTNELEAYDDEDDDYDEDEEDDEDDDYDEGAYVDEDDEDDEDIFEVTDRR